MHSSPWLILTGFLLCCFGPSAQAQFYGGYYGNGFPGGGMPGYAPPLPMGGYYPPPYGGMAPGYGYGVGIGNSSNFYGAVAPGYAPYGGAGASNPFVGYPGFGWWPLSATDVKVTAIPNRSFPGQSFSGNDGAAAGGVPQQSAGPVSAPAIPTGADIKLICPKETVSSLTYTLNGTVYTTHPGYSQAFQDDRAWKLQFQRSSDTADVVSYTLKPGKYNFAIGSSGWELHQVVKVPIGGLPAAPQPMPIESPEPDRSPIPASARNPAT